MRIPIKLMPQGVIPRDPNLTFRVAKVAPAQTSTTTVGREFVRATLFHDAYDGSGDLTGHTADSGQAWDAVEWYPANCVLGGGAVTASAQGVNAGARNLIGPYAPGNYDWTTIISATTDGQPFAGTMSAVESDLQTAAEDEYFNWAVAPYDSGVGGPVMYLGWTDDSASVDLAAFGGSFTLEVQHRVVVKIRGSAVMVEWDGIQVYTGTGLTLFSAIEEIYVKMFAQINNGCTYIIHDSLLESLT